MTVTGKPGAYRVQLAAPMPSMTCGRVTFENVEILGVPLTAGSDRVQAGPHVADLHFK